MKKAILKGIFCAGALMMGIGAANAQWSPTTTGTTADISRTGNVGIGTTPTTGYKLTINGSTSLIGGLQVLSNIIGSRNTGSVNNNDFSIAANTNFF